VTVRLAVVALLGIALAGGAAASDAGLPPLPRGWPATLELGLSDGPGGAAALRGAAPFRFRYQYLAGGVNTGHGWATWNPGGSFVSMYVADSAARGIVPVFSYYMLLQSKPGGADEAAADLGNLRNAATMRAYWEDLELFFRRAEAKGTVVLHLEPDLWGYAEQAARGDDARTVPVTGVGSVAGFARRIVGLRDRLAPNVLLAWHLSGWGTKEDILYSKPPLAHVDELARRAARFYRSLGAAFDLVFTDESDRDAAFKEKIYGDGGKSWWSAGDYRRHVRFLATFSRESRKRVVVWQIPLGNTLMRAQDNSWGHFQDNHVQTVLGGSRAQLRAYAQAGVIAFLFGGGADGTTCACDARKDGVTDPAPINGNARASLSADDDGGYFRARARAYYRAGAVPLPR
jgi:hypothetical protein